MLGNKQKSKMVMGLGILFLGGCNFSDLPPAEQSLNNSLTNSSQCTVDADKLDQFAETDVSSELNCIEAKLKLYSAVDQRQDPEVLNLEELTRFMQTFMKEPDDLEHGVTTLFTINELVFNAPKGQIKVSGIKTLFDFLRETNRLITPVYSIFLMISQTGDVLESDYYAKRTQGLESLQALANYFSQTLSQYCEQRPVWVIDDVLNAALTPKNGEFIEDLRALKFLKVLLLGGDENNITFDEVLVLFQKIPQLAELPYDIAVGLRTLFSNDFAYLTLLREKVSQFQALMFHSLKNNPSDPNEEEANEHYFHYTKLIEASTRYAEYLIDLAPIKDSVYEVKMSPFLGDQDEYFTYKNMQNVIFYLGDVLHKLQYFQKMWELNEKVLTDSEAVDDSKLKDEPMADQNEKAYNKEFKKMIKTYHYFRGDTPVPLYDNPHKRNFLGLGEIAVFEYVVKLFMKAYGSQRREDKITEKDFLGIVLRFDDFVTEMKLWKNPVSGMVKTNYLMMDFFRNNSNTNGYIDLAEGIEYITMQLTAFHIANDFYPKLEQDCLDTAGCDLSEYPGGVPTKFFYENFLEHFIEWRAEFPNLYKYYLGLTDEQAFDYIRNMSKFARQCPYDYDDGDNEIPIKKRDMILITGGIVSLEETFLVLDLNKDNFLTYDELELAVDRFEDAIVDFAKLSDSTKFLARTIFYYLVLKQELPTATQALLYHVNFNLFVNKKKIAADRGAIAGLLKNFTSPPSEPDPDCYTDKPVPR